MSAYIPFEVKEEIMKRLPVKTLIQFKMVSKPWKALIESSKFMTDYNISQTGPHHLFIRFANNYNRDIEHVSVLDDNNKTFPQHRIWDTLDTVIFMINERHLPWSVEVFRLSTGVWTNRPLNRPICFTSYDQVDVNGFIYCCVFDKGIASFDMKSEKFIDVKVPKCLKSKWLHISKIRESLGVLDYYEEAESVTRVCAVWMLMENGVQKLFKKLYTISTQVPLLKVSGFRSCGKPIVGTTSADDDKGLRVLLSVYEPHSKNIECLAIYRIHYSSSTLFVSPYTETLLLLNHPDNHGKPIPYRRRTIS